MSILESKFGHGVAFFGLASAYSAIPFYFWRQQPKNTLILVAYMYGPAAAALTMEKLVHGKIRWEQLGVRWQKPTLTWRFLVSALAPLLVSPVIALLSKLIFPTVIKLSANPGDSLLKNLDRYGLSQEQIAQAKESIVLKNILPTAIFGGLFAGITINAVAAFGEELGWRGWLLRHLKDSGLPFWQRVTVSGLMWGAWHWPMLYCGYNYPEHPKIGMALFPIFCTALSAISSLVTEVSDSKLSALNASVFHGEINAFGGFPLLFATGGDDLTSGACSIPGIISWSLAAVSVFLARKYEWISFEK